MLALTFSSLKEATSHLFAQTTFDCFDVLEASISSYINFSMDGHLNTSFFDDSSESEECQSRFCSWKRLRPVCFSIIKGKQPPISFQISLFLDVNNIRTVFPEADVTANPDIEGFIIRFSYKNKSLSLSTGTVFFNFSMDRDSEHWWDRTIRKWITNIGLSFDEP